MIWDLSETALFDDDEIVPIKKSLPDIAIRMLNFLF